MGTTMVPIITHTMAGIILRMLLRVPRVGITTTMVVTTHKLFRKFRQAHKAAIHIRPNITPTTIIKKLMANQQVSNQ